MTLHSASSFQVCAEEKAVQVRRFIVLVKLLKLEEEPFDCRPRLLRLQWSEQCLRAVREGNHEDALSCGKKALTLQPCNSTVRDAVALLEQLVSSGANMILLQSARIMWAHMDPATGVSELVQMALTAALSRAAVLMTVTATRTIVNLDQTHQTVAVRNQRAL